MRIQRFDLLRYGRFTDTHIELPASNYDFHFVLGPNEAGKSTAMSATEDLLFGIPNNSRYNFLHDYGAMRVGAILQNGGKSLEVRRRKGHKDTLLTADELPVAGADGALAAFLAGADKPFFVRMFSLDHERLRKGGREILEAQDEVGQMLFSAGTGVSGLRDRLKALTDEADRLWAPRKAAHRKYYQSLERLDAADKALREHTITATKWQEINRAYESAQEAYGALEKEIERNLSNQRKLNRIRRVYRDVRKITVLNENIEALGKIVRLPDDAHSKLEAAEREHDAATARGETLKEQLEGEQRQRNALACDEELLLREDDIQEFHKRRIEVQKEKSDLPNRRAELASAEENLRRLAEELEWEVSDVEQLVKKTPPRAKVAAVRALLNSRGGRVSDIANAKGAVEDAENEVAELQQELDAMTGPVDVSRLAIVVKAARDTGDIGARINTAEGDIREANALIQRCLKSLQPQLGEETLVSISVPTRDMVQQHRDTLRSADQQLQACRQRIRTAEQDSARHRKAYERLARDEDAVAPKDVADARARRDTGWSLIRRHYVESASVSDAEIQAFAGDKADLPGAYEAAIGDADALADRRSDNAQAAAQIAMTSRLIGEQLELLEGLRDEERKRVEEHDALEAAWRKMWSATPFEPLAPDLMLEWLTCRKEISDAMQRHAAGERQLSAVRREESETKGRILAELARAIDDTEVQEDQPLRIVVEAAAAVQTRHEAVAAARRQLADRLRKIRVETGRKRSALETAEAAWADWEAKWVAAVNIVGLKEGTSPEAVAAQLDNIDRMREIAVEINQLRSERIQKIERDIDLFAQNVTTLVAAVADDLLGINAEDAVLEMERRLDEAKRIRLEQKNKDDAISSLQKRIDEFETSGRAAHETIRQLQQSASVGDIEQLKAAINSSDNLRDLESERTRIMDSLASEGDGLSLVELSNECDAVDIDQVAAREQSLERELKELQARLIEQAELRTQAKRDFDAIGGDSRAAEAAAARQAALAEMREVAEHYVCTRSAATLLQWAIDRYRREKQAPVLKRAGQIFSILTGAAFDHLQVEFDEYDRAQLTGIRPSGELVRVDGMSTGTADQLYLALRIASIEDYLDRGNALPFVADDLFVNFDDARAAAGFKILGQLSTKTQVLFFTHHQHLVEIAKAALGPTINVVSLLNPVSAIAA
jgi:uncharacterized protein YhaN